MLFIILNLLIFLWRSSAGFISCTFLVFYGLFRIICEKFREPDNHIGYVLGDFTTGTILSVIMIFFGLGLFLRIKYANKNK